jgi:TrmH family RNA methyltransferase
MITSLKNEKVRFVQALQSRRKVRQRQRRFVFEGVRLVEEAVRAGAVADYVLYTEDVRADSRFAALLGSLSHTGATCYVVSDAVMRTCADTQTPQGILAVLPIPEIAPPTESTLTLIADGVRDPGNLGTILRTAWAAGVERVILAPGTVDASNPKVVRAAMGAHLYLPVASLGWQSISGAVADAEVWLAASDGEVTYTDVDWTDTVAIVIGGEGAGASASARMLARGSVSIPMAAGVDSLNTAVAAAVVLFEIRRRRCQGLQR